MGSWEKLSATRPLTLRTSSICCATAGKGRQAKRISKERLLTGLCMMLFMPNMVRGLKGLCGCKSTHFWLKVSKNND